MKKIILSFNQAFNEYEVEEPFRTKYLQLYYLSMALEPVQDIGPEVSINKHDNTAFIWSLDSFKRKAELDFESKQEEDVFDQAYDQYYDKRWDEMPNIDLSIPDWETLKKQWAQIKENNPQYVIFELDDSGPLDRVTLYGKDTLSEQDIADMKLEHEKFLKYERAHQEYINAHPDWSDIWRGPQDDEYETDIMKHYDDMS